MKVNRPKLKFVSKSLGKEFHKEVREAVNEYFRKHHGNIRTAPRQNWFKVSFVALLYILPFIFALTFFADNPWLYLAMFACMGVGMAMIGLNIAHDANHGALSKNTGLNRFAGSIIYLIGIDRAIWQHEHNVEHHTFTNIHGYDSDIAVPFLLRLSPEQKQLKMHRYQHIYAWLLYGVITFRWATFGDFMRFAKNHREAGRPNPKKFRWGMVKLAAWKLLYHGYIWIMPWLLFSVPLPVALGGFLLMQFIAGVMMGTILQAAHIMPDMKFLKPDENMSIQDQWAVHQLATTCNFATRNKVLNWIFGGLNFQIEHHLFPNVSYVHLPKIARIVEEVSKKYKLPYRSYRTFFGAVMAHGSYLKWIGRNKGATLTTSM